MLFDKFMCRRENAVLNPRRPLLVAPIDRLPRSGGPPSVIARGRPIRSRTAGALWHSTPLVSKVLLAWDGRDGLDLIRRREAGVANESACSVIVFLLLSCFFFHIVINFCSDPDAIFVPRTDRPSHGAAFASCLASVGHRWSASAEAGETPSTAWFRCVLCAPRRWRSCC